MHVDNITSTNLSLPASVADKLAPGVKAGTIQQATMMRGGGFGQSRFYLSRNLSSGELGNGDSTNVKVTPDGRWAVFQSLASNLVSGDTNGASDIYRVEISNNQVVRMDRVSLAKTGEQPNGNSFLPQISDDGLLVTFQTEATNLAPPDTNGQPDVMVKSMVTGDVLRMAQTTDGQQPNGLLADHFRRRQHPRFLHPGDQCGQRRQQWRRGRVHRRNPEQPAARRAGSRSASPCPRRTRRTRTARPGSSPPWWTMAPARA